jgi:Glycosyl transferase family 2
MCEDGIPVTVVMPVFNGVEWLDETIHSVEAQRGVQFERIAVDDGSTDGSAALLRSRGWRVLSTNRVGPNGARARALEEAKGKFIAFLDQDDLWHPDHLALAVQSLKSNSRALAAVAKGLPFIDRRRPRLGGRHHGPLTFNPWAFYPITLIDTPSMVVIRRSALEEVGGWPADRSLGSDPLLWWRLSVDAPLAILPRRTVGIRRSEHSLSAVSRSRPLDYLRHLSNAATDALVGLPLGFGVGNAAASAHILAAVSSVVAAAIDGKCLGAAAQNLEFALGDASDDMVIATIGFCGWLLAPKLRRAPAGEIDPLVAIIDTWPAEARRTRKAALQMVAAVAGPWRASQIAAAKFPDTGRLSTAAAAWAFAFAARCGRIADPLSLPSGPGPSAIATESPR